MPQEQSSAAPIVLIVEIDVLLRLVTASNLRDAGFEVIEAANPRRHSASWIVSR
jgi:DNA-binding response OmpR family regulator